MTTTAQAPETTEGHYYVSVVRGDKYILALGPFTNDHASALARVDEVRRIANDLDPRTAFDAFGTCRLSLDTENVPTGKLNARLGL